MDNNADVLQKAKLGKTVILVMAGLIIFLSCWLIYYKVTLEKKNCNNMNSLYKDFPLIQSINIENATFSHSLRDYYVKTAYNCCCAGEYKNDFVSTCALKDCIKQGARCLDFEIYSVKNKPVIAVSSINDYTVKETFNSIPFATVMDVINDYAFSGSTSPCPSDPLILHFRIMSKNKPIYDTMATDLYNILSDRMLGNDYSYENHGKNIGQCPLKKLMGKIVIIVDKSNALFEKTPLDEYVNIASNSIFMRALTYDDVKYTPDMDELVDFNKKNMTICIPNLSASAANPAPAVAMSYGCQFVALAFQSFDQYMEYYDLFFDEAGSAFVLKPVNLRYIPVTIDKPAPPPASNSYDQRNVSTDYYSFSI